MNYFKLLFLVLLLLTSCTIDKKQKKEASISTKDTADFVIAFGSCNNQNLPNTLWKDIVKNNPVLWVWGGDIIYSDTEDMAYMQQNYLKQKNNTDYAEFTKNIDVLGTWDDHDYGLNDGGTEYQKKAEAQQLFLDFFDVPKNDKRRQQEGIYTSKEYEIDNHKIKVIVLDTRYFRTALTPDNDTKKRYKPNTYGEGTMLGEVQWNWLKDELKNSDATFTVIMSSIQFLSSEHGFESWGNMPHEVEKLESLLKETNTKNAILLSGDRHISEFSKKDIEELSYPLIDFTSSGLTHSYTNYKGEPNKYRVGKVVSEKSFGLLKFNFKNHEVTMEIRGENNALLGAHSQKYN